MTTTTTTTIADLARQLLDLDEGELEDTWRGSMRGGKK